MIYLSISCSVFYIFPTTLLAFQEQALDFPFGHNTRFTHTDISIGSNIQDFGVAIR